MSSRAGWYWIAAGVFAFGLINSPANERLGTAVDDSVQVAQKISDEFTYRAGSVAAALSSEPKFNVQTQFMVNDIQKRVECERIKVVRQQAVIVHIQEANMRIVRLAPMPRPVISMPKLNLRVDPRCAKVPQSRDKI